MNVIIQPRAKKDLKKLPKKTISNLLKKINNIKDNPLRYIERLKGSHLFKLRIGDHRAILYLNTKDNKIHVLKIGHRKEIYKRLK
jgi:mRNA interferase RelE/StbE